jgi:hypothetical protein
MHPKVMSARAWAVVRRIASAGLLDGWFLAEETALALQFGHRLSEDLDFFRAGAVDPQALIDRLSKHGPLAIQSRAAGTLHVTLDRIRLSFLKAQAPLLFQGTPYRGMQISDPRDIAVMKLVAIGGRGSRKDFVDLFFLLRSGMALETVMDLVRRRFTGIDFNDYHLLKPLVYFDDAESEPMPRMLRRASWLEIKKTIVAEVKRLI